MRTGFRPLMGIILFNEEVVQKAIRAHTSDVFPSPNGDYFILFNLRGKNVALHTIVWFSFRPLMGIILFNNVSIG